MNPKLLAVRAIRQVINVCGSQLLELEHTGAIPISKDDKLQRARKSAGECASFLLDWIEEDQGNG